MARGNKATDKVGGRGKVRAVPLAKLQVALSDFMEAAGTWDAKTLFKDPREHSWGCPHVSSIEFWLFPFACASSCTWSCPNFCFWLRHSFSLDIAQFLTPLWVCKILHLVRTKLLSLAQTLILSSWSMPLPALIHHCPGSTSAADLEDASQGSPLA